ncbi:MAG: ASCH domain-containing protein [Treponemataceae bacterium]|nr:ASCH domain-containing protein [Treponemataceae bacterium]
MGKVEDYWNNFVQESPDRKNLPYGGEMSFGTDEKMSAELTALVLSGKKSGTTSALEAYRIDNEKLPKTGVYSVLTDWEGNPLGIIKEIKVDILPFNQVPWSMAEKEGEDESLESWRENHEEFFKEDGDIMGYEFTPDMPVVFEEFCLVHKGPIQP